MKLHLTLKDADAGFLGATYTVPAAEAETLEAATGRPWVEGRPLRDSAFHAAARGAGLPHFRAFVTCDGGEVVEYGLCRRRRHAPGCKCEIAEGYADPDRPACTCDLDLAPVLDLDRCEIPTGRLVDLAG